VDGDPAQILALKVLGVAILVALNGFFVAAEFALVKVRETRLARLASDGAFGARLALHLVRHLNPYLSAAQVGITLTSLGIGWLGELALANAFVPIFARFGLGAVAAHSVSATIVFALIVFLHVVVGEQAPKVLAIRQAESTARAIAWPMRVFHDLAWPGIWILNSASLALLRLVGLEKADAHDSAHSAEELRALLEQSSRTKQLTPVAGSLLLNALDLRRRRARQVMLHRTRIAFLSTQRSLDENLKVARDTGHSRFPLCDGSIDAIVGMVHLKDLVWLARDGGAAGDINSVKRDVLFVPESMPLERLLNTFLTRRIHMAILVDEYGTVVGMVTLENILEEIVGDIHDEFDPKEALMIQKTAEGEFRIHGELPLHDLESPLGLHLTAEDVTTVGGYLVKECGHFPQENEVVRVGDWAFTVLRADGRQILHLSAKRAPAVSDFRFDAA
jgi:CBS domain containing-hemolysin-like protein